MTDFSFTIVGSLMQGAAPFSTTAVAAVVVGFLGGSIVTAIFFLITRRRGTPQPPVETPAFTSSLAKRVNIRRCSQCDSTYTDEEITYCLRDGTLLKVVGTMPAPTDPEETRVINRNR